MLFRLTRRKDVPHAVLAVESGDGVFHYSGAAGAADDSGVPMQPDTPFFIASIDKTYTACIVLKLCESKAIGLDQPVSSFLPNALIGGLHRLKGTDHTGAITIRNLLSHTSGLPDWLEDRPKRGRSLIDWLMDGGDREMSLGDILEIVREHLVPHFPPQSGGAAHPKVRYSDTNFVLLAAVIEAVTSKPFGEVCEQMLLRPLQLRRTWMLGHGEPMERVLEPALLWAGGRPLRLPLMLKSIWSVYSTAEDAIRFLRALMQGAVFDNPETLSRMQRWNRFGFPLDYAALRSPNWPIQYGLGLMRFRVPRFGPRLHLIGHSGSTGCWLFHCPQLDVYLAGSVDQATAGALPYRFLPKVLRALERGNLRSSRGEGQGARMKI